MAGPPDEKGEHWFYGNLPFFKIVESVSNRDRHVYILKVKNRYKIGITKNLEKRLRELQTGNPDEIMLVCANFIPNASELEANLHRELAHYRIRGEWFQLPDEELEKAIEIVETGEL